MDALRYNYDAFRKEMAWQNLHFHGGPQPGTPAPDFELPVLGGGSFRLSHRSGKPVLIEFGSITCPMTAGARAGMRRLHHRYEHRIQFLSIYVREAHPGERYRRHLSLEEKISHAADWAAKDFITWPVAVDSLEGTVHEAYGLLPNGAYLIDATGQVAFRALWAGNRLLLAAQIRELIAREDRGENSAVLGQREDNALPLLRGAAEFDYAVGRAGEQALQNFRREMGPWMYRTERALSLLEPLINPGNRQLHHGWARK
jgi:hypothetical protein